MANFQYEGHRPESILFWAETFFKSQYSTKYLNCNLNPKVNLFLYICRLLLVFAILHLRCIVLCSLTFFLLFYLCFIKRLVCHFSKSHLELLKKFLEVKHLSPFVRGQYSNQKKNCYNTICANQILSDTCYSRLNIKYSLMVTALQGIET